MKKHQKVLLGLMVLGLAGTVGTTFALTRKSATSSINGGLDQAIYLNWGGDSQNEATQAAVTGLEARVSQYRYLVASPKATNLLEGKVTITFTAAIGDKQEMTGLTIDVYSVAAYETSTFVTSTEEGTAPDKLECTIDKDNLAKSVEFDVDGATEGNPTKYYTLVFTWDGSDPAEGNEIGATLTISQDFTKTN